MPPASRSRTAAGLVVVSACAALLTVGCARPPAASLPHLAPEAPASRGLPPLPLSGRPTPLPEKSPFGLYADAPSADTLDRLSTGTLSPDGRFRFALTTQGVWIARIDGAWVWEISLPVPPPPADSQEGRQTQPAGATPAAPVAPQPPAPVDPLHWTNQGKLLFPDQAGTWYLADPLTTGVRPLPPALKGKQELTFSPDGTQVFYLSPGKSGPQLWLAKADGTGPKLLGTNLAARWDEATGVVVVTPRSASPGTGVRARNTRPHGTPPVQ